MKKIFVLALLSCFLILSGCGAPFHKKLDTYLMNGQYSLADELIEAEKAKGWEYNDKNELLYYFDKGSVTQMLGNYKISGEFLDKADLMMEKLYTKSAVDEAGAFLSNDLNIKYAGEDFEQVMVSILKALNFMYMDDFDAARVEARKVNNKLNYFADTYGDKAIYTDDAFARYLTGFCYEAAGDMNDAYIDYKKSYETYGKYSVLYGVMAPDGLKADLIRTALALKFDEEAEAYKNEFGAISYADNAKLRNSAEIMVVVYDGMPAYKTEGAGHMPVFSVRGYSVSSVEVYARGVTGTPFVAQDLSTMAVRNLENKNGWILLKSVTRNVVKNLLKEIAPISKLFLGEDKADTRCWRTIPSRFQVVRMAVEPGRTQALVKIQSVRGEEREEVFELDLKAGQKKVLPVYCFY